MNTRLVAELLRSRDPALQARVHRELFALGLDGTEQLFIDVMSDGCEGGLDARIPALRLLLRHGTADERLNAALLLVAWDDERGLRELIRWTALPADVPWGGANRFTGEDTTFGLLADALAHGGATPRAASALPLRIAATRALLTRAADHDCERHLGYLLATDDAIRPALTADLEAAAEHAIALLESGHRPRFDLWTQAAGLLSGLAIEADARAAELAHRLIRISGADRRTLLELVDAMSAGTGPASRAVLEHLRGSDVREVGEHAARCLARRPA